MEILEVCVGAPQDVTFGGKTVTTSIFKSPRNGPCALTETNIDGDRQSDLSTHGGRDKAIYVYSNDYHDAWAKELGFKQLEPSQFGQNLTINGGNDEQVVVGARYRIGDIIAVVTQPRIPCYKLGVRMNDATFPNRFWAAGRLGFYLRIEQTGNIERGQLLELIDAPEHGISIRRLYNIVVDGSAPDAANALECLPHLDAGWQRRLRRRRGAAYATGLTQKN